MRIDKKLHSAVVDRYISRDENMLPYYAGGRRSLRMQDRNERKNADSSNIDDLARKVDWLYEEVRYIKQTLDDYRRAHRTYDHNPVFEGQYEARLYDQNSHRHSVPRSSVLSPPSDHVTYYDPPHTASRDTQQQSFLLTTTTSSSTGRPYCRSDSSHDDIPTSRSRGYQETIGRNEQRETHPSTGNESPSSIAAKPDGMVDLMACIPEDITIAEIIVLWERGMNEIPPIVEWTPQDKLKNREKLELFFKVYHIYRVMCNADMSHFISQYTDLGRMRSPSYVASACPDVLESFESFLQANKQQQLNSYDLSSDKLYTLPRKINGRKVSAKDVIRLWEYGMGDVPPIKSWTKAQKFKQQSKISRWKKIVDIFKYQCNSNMRKFEEIYTDSHGCLLPVAAITNKFETLYGDELNITSKLMTVTTSEQNKQQQQQPQQQQQQQQQQQENRKRKITEDSLSDVESAQNDDTLSVPPLLVPVTSSTMSPPKLIKHEDDDLKYSQHSDEKHIESPLHQLPQTSHLSNGSTTVAGLTYDDQSSPSSIGDSVTEDGHEKRNGASVIYIVPEHFALKEAIMYWENGSHDFPPVKTWTHVQNSIQHELITKIEKLYDIFCDTFQQDMDAFLSSSIDEKGDEIPIEQFLSKFSRGDHEVNSGRNVKIGNANSMTFDFSHHKTISQSTDALYLLPRKINGRKVSAKDVLQLWYHGLNKIPPVKQWSPQQKAVQQSKISRWKKIVELFEQDFSGDWEKFQKHYSNSLGQLLPITAIISKHEEESRSMTEGSYHPHL